MCAAKHVQTNSGLFILFSFNVGLFSVNSCQFNVYDKFQTQEAVKNESREGLSKIVNCQIKHILHTLCVVSTSDETTKWHLFDF